MKRIIKCECCGFIAIINNEINNKTKLTDLLCSFCYQPGLKCSAKFVELDNDDLLKELGLKKCHILNA